MLAVATVPKGKHGEPKEALGAPISEGFLPFQAEIFRFVKLQLVPRGWLRSLVRLGMQFVLSSGSSCSWCSGAWGALAVESSGLNN